MFSMPTTICPECYKKFTTAIESDKVESGLINIFCKHNAVLMCAEISHGLLTNWLLLPSSSQESSFELVEKLRRELVEKINKTLAIKN